MASVKDNHIIIYRPNQRFEAGFLNIFVTSSRNIIQSKDLIWQLFKRDFLMQYKKSFLSWGWLILSPIIGVLSWIFMNRTGVLTPGDVGIPYPAFVLISSSVWGLFMGFYSSASETLSAGSGFINQVKYPHEVLLVKQALQQVANFLIVFVLNLIALIVSGVTPSLALVLFPLVTLPLFFFAAGLGLVTSLINVVATDVTKIFNTFLGFVFYITPVIYTADEKDDLLQTIVKYNPLSYLIDAGRDIVIYGRIDNFDIFLYISLGAFVFFLLCWRLFYIAEDRIIERMF